MNCSITIKITDFFPKKDIIQFNNFLCSIKGDNEHEGKIPLFSKDFTFYKDQIYNINSDLKYKIRLFNTIESSFIGMCEVNIPLTVLNKIELPGSFFSAQKIKVLIDEKTKRKLFGSIVSSREIYLLINIEINLSKSGKSQKKSSKNKAKKNIRRNYCSPSIFNRNNDKIKIGKNYLMNEYKRINNNKAKNESKNEFNKIHFDSKNDFYKTTKTVSNHFYNRPLSNSSINNNYNNNINNSLIIKNKENINNNNIKKNNSKNKITKNNTASLFQLLEKRFEVENQNKSKDNFQKFKRNSKIDEKNNKNVVYKRKSATKLTLNNIQNENINLSSQQNDSNIIYNQKFYGTSNNIFEYTTENDKNTEKMNNIFSSLLCTKSKIDRDALNIDKEIIEKSSILRFDFYNQIYNTNSYNTYINNSKNINHSGFNYSQTLVQLDTSGNESKKINHALQKSRMSLNLNTNLTHNKSQKNISIKINKNLGGSIEYDLSKTTKNFNDISQCQTTMSFNYGISQEDLKINILNLIDFFKLITKKINLIQNKNDKDRKKSVVMREKFYNGLKQNNILTQNIITTKSKKFKHVNLNTALNEKIIEPLIRIKKMEKNILEHLVNIRFRKCDIIDYREKKRKKIIHEQNVMHLFLILIKNVINYHGNISFVFNGDEAKKLFLKIALMKYEIKEKEADRNIFIQKYSYRQESNRNNIKIIKEVDEEKEEDEKDQEEEDDYDNITNQEKKIINRKLFEEFPHKYAIQDEFIHKNGNLYLFKNKEVYVNVLNQDIELIVDNKKYDLDDFAKYFIYDVIEENENSFETGAEIKNESQNSDEKVEGQSNKKEYNIKDDDSFYGCRKNTMDIKYKESKEIIGNKNDSNLKDIEN